MAQTGPYMQVSGRQSDSFRKQRSNKPDGSSDNLSACVPAAVPRSPCSKSLFRHCVVRATANAQILHSNELFTRLCSLDSEFRSLVGGGSRNTEDCSLFRQYHPKIDVFEEVFSQRADRQAVACSWRMTDVQDWYPLTRTINQTGGLEPSFTTCHAHSIRWQRFQRNPNAATNIENHLTRKKCSFTSENSKSSPLIHRAQGETFSGTTRAKPKLSFRFASEPCVAVRGSNIWKQGLCFCWLWQKAWEK